MRRGHTTSLKVTSLTIQGGVIVVAAEAGGGKYHCPASTISEHSAPFCLSIVLPISLFHITNHVMSTITVFFFCIFSSIIVTLNVSNISELT